MGVWYDVQCCKGLVSRLVLMFLVTYMPFQDVTQKVAVEEEEGDAPTTSTATDTSTPRQCNAIGYSAENILWPTREYAKLLCVRHR